MQNKLSKKWLEGFSLSFENDTNKNNILKIKVNSKLNYNRLPSVDELLHIILIIHSINNFNTIDLRSNKLGENRELLYLLTKASLGLPNIEKLCLLNNNLVNCDHAMIFNLVKETNPQNLTSIDLRLNHLQPKLIGQISPSSSNCKFDLSNQLKVEKPVLNMIFKSATKIQDAVQLTSITTKKLLTAKL